MELIANLRPNRRNGDIKARVTWKTAVWYKETEIFAGNLFTIYLMDASGEIIATAFKDECEKFFDLIEIGNVYIFSEYDVQPVDIGRYYWPHKNRYEIHFTDKTKVRLCEDNDDGGIPDIKLDLLPIPQVRNKRINEFVDTIGFCTYVGGMDQANTPTGLKPIRDITLAHHMSGDSVTLTLWYEEANNFDGQVGSLILVRGSRIHIWDGVTKLNGGQVLKINVNTPNNGRILQLFEKVGNERNGESRLLVNVSINIVFKIKYC